MVEKERRKKKKEEKTRSACRRIVVGFRIVVNARIHTGDGGQASENENKRETGKKRERREGGGHRELLQPAIRSLGVGLAA